MECPGFCLEPSRGAVDSRGAQLYGLRVLEGLNLSLSIGSNEGPGTASVDCQTDFKGAMGPLNKYAHFHAYALRGELGLRILPYSPRGLGPSVVKLPRGQQGQVEIFGSLAWLCLWALGCVIHLKLQPASLPINDRVKQGAV